jgi:hypothetical protein
VADKEQRQDRVGLTANPTVASAMEPGFTSVDLFLIPFWGCLQFLYLTNLHPLVQLGSLLYGRAQLQLGIAMGESLDTASVRPARRQCRPA